MTYFEVYILLPLLALALDWLVGVLRLPRVAIFGTTADPLPLRDDARTRTYVCAVHNDGDRLFEDRNHPVLIRIQVLGEESFPVNLQLKGQVGPHKDIGARWADAERKKFVIEIPRLRPWKTLFFTWKVPISTYQTRMEVLVPNTSIFRTFLEWINEHQYSFSRLAYSTASIEVARRPQRRTLLDGWKGWAQIAGPMAFVITFFYVVFWRVLLSPLMERAAEQGSSVTWPRFFQPGSVFLDAALVVLGMIILWLMFRDKGEPIVSGYRESTQLVIQPFVEPGGTKHPA